MKKKTISEKVLETLKEDVYTIIKNAKRIKRPLAGNHFGAFPP